MRILPLLHIVTATTALISGASVLLRPKGGPRHRIWGKVYFGSMLVMNLSALLIFRLFGGFGPFHAAALASLGTVIPAFVAVRRRRPGWLVRHYYWMTFSYVGLLAALVSEVATRLPEAPFWGAVVVASLAVILIGGVVIFLRAATVLAPFRRG